MKKTLITIIIVGLVLLVVGKAIMMFSEKQDESMSIINNNENLNLNSSEIKDNYVIIEQEFDNVENLNLSLGIYRVLIESDSSINKVKVTAKKPIYKQGGKDINKLDINYSNGNLVIEQNQEGKSFNVGNLNLDNLKGEILIKVPESFNINKINIENGVGLIEVKGVKLNTLDIDCGTSSVTASNLIMNNCYVSGGTGSNKFTNTTTDILKVDSGTGSAYYSGDILDKANISTGTNKVELELNGKEDVYNFDIETGLGSIKINDKSYKKEINLNSNADRGITVETGTGSVNINTK